MSMIQVDDVATGAFGEWIQEGTDTHLLKIRRAALHTPSEALATAALERVSALRALTAQHLSVVNSCRSSFLRLPRELLADILLYAVSASGGYVWRWIYLGQICSALRGVLLGLHRLWRDSIYSWSFDERGQHRDELLKRAGPTVPLQLKVPANDRIPDATQFAINHAARARSIDAFHASFVEWFVQNVDSSPLLHLERVHLSHGNDTDTPIAALEQPARIVPRLKEARIHNVFWNFHASTLVHLEISCNEPARLYTTSRFVAILSRTAHSLRHLALENCLPWIAENEEDIVALPSLETLDVGDTREYALQLWRMLRVPSDTCVNLTLFCEPSDYTRQGPSCFQEFGLFKHHLRGRQALRCHLWSEDDYSPLIFRFYSISDSGDLAAAALSAVASSQETLTLAYDIPPEDELAVAEMQKDALHCMGNALDLYNIGHLSFASKLPSSIYDDAYWIDVLQGFTSLERLELDKWTRSICSVLTVHVSITALNTDNNRTSALLLPSLRELVLSTARFMRKETSEPESTTTAGLAAMIRSRAVAGRHLELLRIGTADVEYVPRSSTSVLKELSSQFPDCRFEIEKSTVFLPALERRRA